MKTQQEKSQEFVSLHRKGNCFVIPNPWDIGSAKLLEHLGFKALATTGAGFAFSRGQSDLSINARDMLPQLTQLAAVILHSRHAQDDTSNANAMHTDQIESLGRRNARIQAIAADAVYCLEA